MNLRVIAALLLILGAGYVAYTQWPKAGEVAKDEVKQEVQTTTTATSNTQKTTTSTKTTSTTSSSSNGIQLCPLITVTVQAGSKDPAQTPDYMHGDVGKLQVFLARRYGLSEKEFVDGIFGANTETYLKRYQKEKGLPQSGVVDFATQQSLKTPCIDGVKANGTEYTKQNFTLVVGGISAKLSVHEALQQAGSVEQGAFRIELISIMSDSVKVRVTGRVIDGLQSETFTLARGKSHETQNWPTALTLSIDKLDASYATLKIEQKPTD